MSSSLWPWLLVAGAGALHGLNPAGGWALALASSLRAPGRWQALRALGPIALGHLASVALVAGAAVLGATHGPELLVGVAGASMLGLAIGCRRRPARQGARRPAGVRHAGLVLGSFLVSTLHGAGLVLVPALAPLCLDPMRQGSTAEALWLALAAFALHTATMLLVSGAVALSVGRVVQPVLHRILRARWPHKTPSCCDDSCAPRTVSTPPLTRAGPCDGSPR